MNLEVWLIVLIVVTSWLWLPMVLILVAATLAVFGSLLARLACWD